MERLSSWKEIAAYLQVSTKTAQLWERDRSMPVYRMEPRSQVWAKPAELDQWRAANAKGNLPESEPRPAVPRWRAALIGVAALAVIGIAAAWINRPMLAAAAIEGDTLVARDAAGNVLFRRFFPGLNKFESQDRQVWAGSLDGRRAVLMVLARYSSDTAPLLCLDSSGQELWRFEPGRTLRSATEEFGSRYGISQFKVLPDGRIVVASFHQTYYPSQIALLSPQGRLLREYWHSGHLREIATADLDFDGRPEIYVGGINNARRAATIVVLDPDAMGGAAQEDPGFTLLGLAPGIEKRRILLPPS